MIEKWIEEIKASSDPDELGMIVIHQGVVRGTSKDGRKVWGIELTYNRTELNRIQKEFEQRRGIESVRIWINEGSLPVGADIMKVCVAGRFRTDVLPVFEELISLIKNRVVSEKEILSPPFT
ncbi:MAG: molybdenum cofactor biosynthesis protein MoaE [Syntrophales bacterium]|nr:molybdenum cofactor biosynthesis protein MoaE [Syntrophales bacterium]